MAPERDAEPPRAGKQAVERTEAPPRVEVQASEPWGFALRIALAAVGVGVALWLAVTLREILLQLLIATILATGLNPLVMFLKSHGVPRAAAVLLIYLALIVGLVALGIVVVPPIVQEIDEVLRNAPHYGDLATQFLQDLQAQFPFLPPLDEQILEQVRGLGAQLGAIATQALAVARFALTLFSGLLSTLLVLLIALYLIVDGQRIRDYLISFVPTGRWPRARRVMDAIGVRMGGWLIGQVALILIVGFTSYVGLSLLGIPGAPVLALIAGIGEAIPIVGPIISAVPAVIVAFTVSPVHGALTAGLYLLIQQLENYLLVPKLMERAVNLHPLAVVLALIVGGELQGVLGAIVAVPLAAAIAVVLNEVRHVRHNEADETSRRPVAPPPPGPAGPATAVPEG